MNELNNIFAFNDSEASRDAQNYRIVPSQNRNHPFDVQFKDGRRKWSHYARVKTVNDGNRLIDELRAK